MAGLLRSLTDRFQPTPLSMGLINAGANMMMAGGPSRMPVNLGSTLGAGLQGLLQGYSIENEAQSDSARQEALMQQQIENNLLERKIKKAQLLSMDKPKGSSLGYIPANSVPYTDPVTGLKAMKDPQGNLYPISQGLSQYQEIMTDPSKVAQIAEARKRAEGAGTLIERETPLGTEKVYYGDASGNNNPGNLRVPGKKEFQSFPDRQSGYDAIANQIKLYGSRGINTLDKIASTYAPPIENDTKTYIQNLSKFTGYRPDAELNLDDPIVQHAVASAIARQEGAKVYADNKSGVVVAPTKTQQKERDMLIDVKGAGMKQTAELAAKREDEASKREGKAGRMVDLLTQTYQGKTIPQLIESSTGSGLGATVDAVAGYFGKDNQGAINAESLKTLSGWLTAEVPRMEGPQSNADVLQYKEMAGKIGDPTVTPDKKMAAYNTILEIARRQAKLGNPEFASFKNSGASGTWGSGGNNNMTDEELDARLEQLMKGR